MTPGELRELKRLYDKRDVSWGSRAVFNVKLEHHVSDLLKLAAECFDNRKRADKKTADKREALRLRKIIENYNNYVDL
jgi:hypothetical protein